MKRFQTEGNNFATNSKINGLTAGQLTNRLRQLQTDFVDNTIMTSRYIGIKGIHLNFSGMTQLAKSFASALKKSE